MMWLWYAWLQKIRQSLSQSVKKVKGFRRKKARLAIENLETRIVPSPIKARFDQATYYVMESAGSASIGIQFSLDFTTSGSFTTTYATTVSYATSSIDALPTSDYITTTGTKSFSGTMSTIATSSFSVPIVNDSVWEPNESLLLTLSNPTGDGQLVSPSTALLIITDDDPPPTVGIVPGYTVNENAGSVAISVTLSYGISASATVSYHTADGNAMQPSDYTSTNGVLTFAPSQTLKVVYVPITDDTITESNESFWFALDSGSNANLGSSNFTYVTIIDNDDPAVTFQASHYSVSENWGYASLDISLNAPSAQTVTVQYQTSDLGTAAHPATAGSDYTATTGTVIFYPGETWHQAYIPIRSDPFDEFDEDFKVSLLNPSHAVLGATPATTVTILDDDNPIQVRFEQATYGAMENQGSATIGVQFSLDFISTESFTTSMTVNYSTSSIDAIPTNDYLTTNGTLTFDGSGTTTRYFYVPIVNDNYWEPSESLQLTLSSPTNGAVLASPSTALLVISDDDSPPTVGIVPGYTVNENAGSVTISVTLSYPMSAAATVSYHTADGSAMQPGDYTATSGVLTFAPSETLKLVYVPITNDTIPELQESFWFNLDSATSATLGSSNYTYITIVDDDNPDVTFQTTNYSVNEWAGYASLDISLTGPSSQTITVEYQTSNLGTAAHPASAGADYTATLGTVTFMPGETWKQASVSITNDTIDEYDEDFKVALQNPSHANLGAHPQATVTILDDDDPPAVHFTSMNYRTSESHPSLAITVTLDRPSEKNITVQYHTSDLDARAGTDYVAATGTLTFAPLQTTQTFVVDIIDDDDFAEPDEHFNVILDNAVNASVDWMSSTTVTIEEDVVGRGMVAFAVEDSAFGASYGTMIGTFSHGSSHTVSEFSAVVNFGDGTTGAASLTGNSSEIFVWMTSPHTYYQEGAYALVTELIGPDLDVQTAAFAADPVLVFSKQDDAVLDYASWSEITTGSGGSYGFYGSDANVYQTTTINGGDWSVDVTATGNFQFQRSGADQFSEYSLSESGSSVVFSLTADGDTDPAYMSHADFAVNDYSISYSGSDTSTRSLTYESEGADRTYSQVESASQSFHGDKSADLSTGNYSWHEASTESRSWSEEGGDDTGADRVDADDTHKMNAHELFADFSQTNTAADNHHTIYDHGNYNSHSFTMTVYDSTSLGYTETGMDMGESYTQIWTTSVIESYAETGNYQTGQFHLDVKFENSGHVDETSGNEALGQDEDSFTLGAVDGNDLVGGYTLTGSSSYSMFMTESDGTAVEGTTDSFGLDRNYQETASLELTGTDGYDTAWAYTNSFSQHDEPTIHKGADGVTDVAYKTIDTTGSDSWTGETSQSDLDAQNKTDTTRWIDKEVADAGDGNPITTTISIQPTAETTTTRLQSAFNMAVQVGTTILNWVSPIKIPKFKQTLSDILGGLGTNADLLDPNSDSVLEGAISRIIPTLGSGPNVLGGLLTGLPRTFDNHALPGSPPLFTSFHVPFNKIEIETPLIAEIVIKIGFEGHVGGSFGVNGPLVAAYLKAGASLSVSAGIATPLDLVDVCLNASAGGEVYFELDNNPLIVSILNGIQNIGQQFRDRISDFVTDAINQLTAQTGGSISGSDAFSRNSEFSTPTTTPPPTEANLQNANTSGSGGPTAADLAQVRDTGNASLATTASSGTTAQDPAVTRLASDMQNAPSIPSVIRNAIGSAVGYVTSFVGARSIGDLIGNAVVNSFLSQFNLSASNPTAFTLPPTFIAQYKWNFGFNISAGFDLLGAAKGSIYAGFTVSGDIGLKLTDYTQTAIPDYKRPERIANAWFNLTVAQEIGAKISLADMLNGYIILSVPTVTTKFSGTLDLTWDTLQNAGTLSIVPLTSLGGYNDPILLTLARAAAQGSMDPIRALIPGVPTQSVITFSTSVQPGVSFRAGVSLVFGGLEPRDTFINISAYNQSSVTNVTKINQFTDITNTTTVDVIHLHLSLHARLMIGGLYGKVDVDAVPLQMPIISAVLIVHSNQGLTERTTKNDRTVSVKVRAGSDILGPYVEFATTTMWLNDTQTVTNQTSAVTTTTTGTDSEFYWEIGNEVNNETYTMRHAWGTKDLTVGVLDTNQSRTINNQASESQNYDSYKSGSYLAGTFTLTETLDTTILTASEVETNLGYWRSANQTGTKSHQVKEIGDTVLGNDSLTTIDTSDLKNNPETITNQSYSATVPSKKIYSSHSFTQIGENITGYYNLKDQQYTSTSYQENGTNQSQVETMTNVTSASTTLIKTQYNLAGSFSLTETNNSGTYANGPVVTTVNGDVLSVSESETSKSSSTLTKTGNAIFGPYSITAGSFGDQSDSRILENNKSLNVTVSNGESETGTRTGSGNVISTDYSFYDIASGNSYSIRNESNQGKVTSSSETATETATLSRQGNDIAATYATSETFTMSLTVVDTETNQGQLYSSTLWQTDTAVAGDWHRDVSQWTSDSQTLVGNYSKTSDDTNGTREIVGNETGTTSYSLSESAGKIAGTYSQFDGTSTGLTRTLVETNQSLTKSTTLTGKEFAATSNTGMDITGSYSMSEWSSSSLSLNESDYNFGKVVNESGVETASASHFETGNDILGTYSLADTQSNWTSVTGRETNSVNAGYSATLNDTDSGNVSTNQTGNFIQGSYSLTSYESDAVTSNRTEYNQTSTVTTVESQMSSITTGETGNDILATYSLNSYATNTLSLSRTDNNQTQLIVDNEWTSASSSLSETGNDIVGDYTQVKWDYETAVNSGTTTNQGRVDNHTENRFTTQSLTENGNMISTAYTITERDWATFTNTVRESNQTYFDTQSIVGNDTLTSQSKTGNEIKGDYTLIGVTKTSQTVNDQNTNQTQAITSTEWDNIGTTVRESANDVTTDYSVSEDSNNTYNMTISEWNQTLFRNGPEYGKEASSRSETQNADQGKLLTQSSNSLSFSLVLFDTNQTLTGTVTEQGIDTDTMSESANDLTGSYSLNETHSMSTATTETRTNQSLFSSIDSSDTLSTSLKNIGNFITGAYTEVAQESNQTSQQQNDNNQFLLFTNTSATTSATNSYFKTGNEITGSFSLSLTEFGTDKTISQETNQSRLVQTSQYATNSPTIQETGNSVTGDYSLSETGTDTLSLHEFTSNQTETTTKDDFSYKPFSLGETGNDVSSKFSLGESDSFSGVMISTVTNQTSTVTDQKYTTGTGTVTEMGNLITTSIDRTATATLTYTLTDTDTNQSRTTTRVELANEYSTDAEHTNDIVGTFAESTTTSQSYVLLFGQEINQTLTDTVLAENGGATESTSEYGNRILGNDTVSDVASSNRTALELETNVSAVTTRTLTAGDSESTGRSGNSILGGYNFMASDSSNYSATEWTNNQSLFSTVTLTTGQGDSETGYDNVITGTFNAYDGHTTLSQQRYETFVNQTQFGSDSEYENTSSSWSETGNEILGDYTLNESSFHTEYAWQTSQNQTQTNTNHSAREASISAYESGNRITGDYDREETNFGDYSLDESETNGATFKYGRTETGYFFGSDSSIGNNTTGSFTLTHLETDYYFTASGNQTHVSQFDTLNEIGNHYTSSTETGNDVTADYELHDLATTSLTESETTTNQVDIVYRSASNMSSDTTDETGNWIDGHFTRTTSSGSITNAGYVDFNQDRTIVGTSLEIETSIASGVTGNSVMNTETVPLGTGTYYSSVREVETNKTYVSTMTEIEDLTTDHSYLGNHITGIYAVTDHDSGVHTLHRVIDNQSLHVVTDITTNPNDGNVNETGNEITGAYVEPLAYTNDPGTRIETLTNGPVLVIATEFTYVDHYEGAGGGNHVTGDASVVLGLSNSTKTVHTTTTNQGMVDNDYETDYFTAWQSESSNFVTAAYSLGETSAMTMIVHDMVTQGTLTRTTDTTEVDTTNAHEIGNEIIGSYTRTETDTNDLAGVEVDTNLSLTATRPLHNWGNSAVTTSGNLVYTTTTASESGFETASLFETDTNHDLTQYVLDLSRSSLSSTQTSNDILGGFITSDFTSTSLSHQQWSVNQTQTPSLSESGSETTSMSSVGNSILGSFYESDSTSSSLTGLETLTNQSLGVTITLNDRAFDSGWKTGNDIVGGYVAARSSSLSTTNNETDTNLTSTATQTEYSYESTTLSQSGNDISGAYSIGETITATLSHIANGSNQTMTYNARENSDSKTTVTNTGSEVTGLNISTEWSYATDTLSRTETNQTQTISVTTYATDNTTVTQSGNDYTGAFSIGEQDSATTTLYQHDQNQSLSLDFTSYETVTSGLTSTGNSIYGNYHETGSADDHSRSYETSNNQTRTISIDTTADTHTNIVYTDGNQFTGLRESEEIATPTVSTVEKDVNQSQAVSITSTVTDTTTLLQSGNDITGSYSLFESSTNTHTANQQGVNDVRSFSFTETGSGGATRLGRGNAITGYDSFSEDAHDTSTTVQSQSYSDTGDWATQTAWVTDTSTLVQYGNFTSGSMTMTQVDGSTTTLWETGTRSNDYSLTQTTFESSAEQTQANEITGEFSQSLSLSVTSSLDRVAVAPSGSFTLSETSNSFTSSTNIGNHITGSYTLTQSQNTDFVHDEWSDNVTTGYTLWEETTTAGDEFRTGNEVNGDYSVSEDSIPTSSLYQEGVNNLGTFTLNQITSDTITVTGTGNDITGAYSLDTSGATTYHWTQTNAVDGEGYSLTVDGVNSYGRTETGSTIDQGYTITESGSDNYTMDQETLTEAVGPFASLASFVASESYDFQQTGNKASGDLVRHVDGTLTYDGAWLNTPYTGTLSYAHDAAGNFLVGSLSFSESGDTRYSLLDQFNNTASGQNGSSPGNADYTPFGQGFRYGSTPDAPTGGVFAPGGSQVVDIDKSTGAHGRTELLTGNELSGAAQLEKYANYGAELFKKFCFAAGTPLLTLTGHKNIEDFRVGDELMAALDTDARSPIGVQVVEELFSNHSPILNLHVGGRIIRTTAEHPIFAWGKGWVAAGSLQPGDRLRSHDGKVVVVEGVAYSGEETTVYNLRVGEWHTYFVGTSDWGFSVWSHNTSVDVASGGAGGAESGSGCEATAQVAGAESPGNGAPEDAQAAQAAAAQPDQQAAEQSKENCFVAGTPLLTPTGDKPIEQFRIGDEILSAPEWNPSAPLEAKLVEDIFTNLAQVFNLHVGGLVIRTTGEHPFFVRGIGWRPAASLAIGDLLRSHDGRWNPVEDLLETNEEETVYNLRVSEYHTYFVGALTWGFSVWAHNSYVEEKDVQKVLKEHGIDLADDDPRLKEIATAASEGDSREVRRLIAGLGQKLGEDAVHIADKLDNLAYERREAQVASQAGGKAEHIEGTGGLVHVGENKLTLEEAAEIQAIANEYQTAIVVVGSRAKNEGHNVHTDKPVGHDKQNERSDIDFRFDTSHEKAAEIMAALNQVGRNSKGQDPAGNASMKHSTTNPDDPMWDPSLVFIPEPMTPDG